MITILSLLLFVSTLSILSLDNRGGEVLAQPQARAAHGSLSKIPNPRTNTLRGVGWNDVTDEAYVVGNGAVYRFIPGTGDLEQLDGPESTDHYYEDIAWRPQGDYAIIVGATPASSKAKGVISKLWKEGPIWRLSTLDTSIRVRLSGIAWSPDGSYAVIVGGARGGESSDVGAIMGRFSATTGQWTEIYYSVSSGLSDVEYNRANGIFYATGLDGNMIDYDGEIYTIVTDNALKRSDLFSITWRDNGGRGLMGGWFSGTLKGHLVTTDGTNQKIIMEIQKYVNDADWAPGSDYSLLVGQSGSIWEYSHIDGLVAVDNTIDSKSYYGVDFDDNGTIGLVVGQDGSILRYNVSYPGEANFPPTVAIASPLDKTIFDFNVDVIFDSNGTHDDDLDALDLEWVSSMDGTLSTEPYFSIKTLTPGDHEITLKVDDSNGHRVASSINITIGTPKDPPFVDAGDPLIGYQGEDLTLKGKVINSDYDIKSYEWDYEGTDDFRTTIGPEALYRYNDVGIFTANFRVTDVRKAVGTDTVTITIFPKRTDANDLAVVEPEGVRQPKDRVFIKIGLSSSKKIDLKYLDPKGKEYPASPRVQDGNVTFEIVLPKDAKGGYYDVKWRYFDANDIASDWYDKPDAFKVKASSTNGNGNVDMLPVLISVSALVFLIMIIIFIFRMFYRGTITQLEAILIFYRDGRIMYISTPTPKVKGQRAMDPSTVLEIQATVQAQISAIKQGNLDRLPSSMTYGRHSIFIEQGVNTFAAVAFRGDEPQYLRKMMKHALQGLEILYGNQLRNWDGTTNRMPSLGATIAKNIFLK